MARRVFAASFVLGSLALVVGQGAATQGCTQDFSTFDASGGGTPASSSLSSTGGPASSGQSTTTVGPGGGEGGSAGGPTTTTGDGGSGAGDQGGAGGGTPCDVVSECDDDEPCTVDACEGGFCTRTAVEDGEPEPGYPDNATDCVTRECSGGEGNDVADTDDDPPESATACLARVCDGMDLVDDPAQPIRENESCGPDPQVCIDGVCIGCDAAADCLPPAGECEVATCVDSACGSDFTADDPFDASMDCRRPTCDGASANAVDVPDTAQTPADIACGVGVCNGMTPDFDDVGRGNDCAVGVGVCDDDGEDATCVECVDDSDSGADSGCSGQTQHCDDSGTPACVRCIPGGATPHLGCNGGAPICNPDGNSGEGECVDCYDDGVDAVGCADPDSDQCKEAPGAGQCFDLCYDDGPGADPGCDDAATPACKESSPQACQECVAPVDCDIVEHPEGTLCNQSGNDECGCSGGENAPSCGGSSRGERCIGNAACGCSGGNGSLDCNHLGAAGPNCNGSVCVL